MERSQPCIAYYDIPNEAQSLNVSGADVWLQVPDGGKVGVIGSGKGLTEFKKQKRHEFNVE